MRWQWIVNAWNRPPATSNYHLHDNDKWILPVEYVQAEVQDVTLHYSKYTLSNEIMEMKCDN